MMMMVFIKIWLVLNDHCQQLTLDDYTRKYYQMDLLKQIAQRVHYPEVVHYRLRWSTIGSGGPL